MGLLNPLSWFRKSPAIEAGDMHEPLIKPAFGRSGFPKNLSVCPMRQSPRYGND